MNDGNIEMFFKDTYSANDSRAAAQRILVSNNVNQGLKSMYFEIKDRELFNALPYEVALRGIKSDQLGMMRKNRDDTKEYINRIESQYHPDMKVNTLTGTHF